MEHVLHPDTKHTLESPSLKPYISMQARLGAAAVEALDAGAFELSAGGASPPLLRTHVQTQAQLPAVRLPGPGGGGGGGSQGVGLALGARQHIRLP